MGDSGLPQNWVKVQLNDLVKNPKSDLVDGPFGSNLKSSEYVESGIPVLKIQNIKANRFVEKRLSYVTPEKAAELSRHSFVAGDLMITKLGEPLGLCCEVPPHLKHGIFVADLMRLRPNPEIISSKFLLHAINSVVVQNQFKEITKGTTRQRVNLLIARDISIELPPLNEQHRIVSKIEELFSELDQGIENLKTAQAQLKVYRQALLKHAFEGKLTATWREQNRDQLETAAALQQRIQKERAQRHQQQLADWEAGGKQGSKPKASKPLPPLTAEELADLPELPEGWFGGRLGLMTCGVEYGTAAKSSESGTCPVLRMGNIQNGKFEWTDLVYTDDESEIAKYLLNDGDVLFNRTNSPELVGKSAIFKSKRQALFAGYLIRVNQIPTIVESEYLNYFLNSHIAKRHGNTVKTDGVNQSNINGEKLINYPFPFCALEEQKVIVTLLEERLSEVDQLDQIIATSLQQAEALRQSILKRAFSGQLVPQDPHDEPASALLARIKASKENMLITKSKRKA